MAVIIQWTRAVTGVEIGTYPILRTSMRTRQCVDANKRGEFFCMWAIGWANETLKIVGGFIHCRVVSPIDVTGANDPPYPGKWNTVFQKYALFPHMTVATILVLACVLKKVIAEIKQRTLSAVDHLR